MITGKNKNKGFTLIEIVSVVVILSILGLFTFAFIENAVKTYSLIKQQYPLYADGTYLMERIVRELSGAITVTRVAPNDLEFTKPPAHAPETVRFTLDPDTHVLRRNNIPIGKRIIEFNPSRGVANEITIALRLRSDTPYNSIIPDFILRTTVLPNNYATPSFNGDYYEIIQ